MNKGTICAKVYSEGVQQIKGKLWTDSCTLRAKDFSSFSICILKGISPLTGPDLTVCRIILQTTICVYKHALARV